MFLASQALNMKPHPPVVMENIRDIIHFSTADTIYEQISNNSRYISANQFLTEFYVVLCILFF